jgi:ribosomal protein S18 acetylase RimI-like enzyme
VRTNLTAAPALAIRLRPASASDEAFLSELYADRRAPEFRALGWGLDDQRVMVEMQFRAQQSGYSAAHPGADHWIPCVGKEPAGRLLLDRNGARHVVVDIVVLSRHRGQGIGTALMQEVLADAGAAGVGVGLTVTAHDQRLIGWYERLGFVPVEEIGLYLAMEARPQGN